MDDATDTARILSELRRDVSALKERRDDDAVINLLRSIAATEAGDVTVTITTGSAASMRVASSARSPQTDREIAFSEIADTEAP